jgi:hypothetical protein
VSIQGNDGERHEIETTSTSVFAAANEGIQSFCKNWWFDLKLPIEVRSGENSWVVDQDAVRKWRTRKSGVQLQAKPEDVS